MTHFIYIHQSSVASFKHLRVHLNHNIHRLIIVVNARNSHGDGLLVVVGVVSVVRRMYNAETQQ